ncbi:MAG: M48 family metalloprotease [Phycisphaerales bacterium]
MNATHFHTTTIAGAVLLTVSGLFSAGCTRNAATNRMQFDLLSTQDEIALGVEAMPALVKEYGGEVSAPELREYVRNIGQSMAVTTEAENPQLPWEFTVLDSDVINAFALPGGKVFISRGLMDYMDNEAQLAATLGHEIGHVTAHHIDERLSQSMGAQLIGEIAGAAAGGSGWGQAVPYVVGAGGQAYLLKFGRDQERESDRLGLRYMTNVGYDPMGMAQMLQILVNVSGGARQPEFLSTHPNPERRYKEALELVESEYSHTQGSPDFDLHRERFERQARPYLKAPPAAVAWGMWWMNGNGQPPAILWCQHCRDEATAESSALPGDIRR